MVPTITSPPSLTPSARVKKSSTKLIASMYARGVSDRICITWLVPGTVASCNLFTPAYSFSIILNLNITIALTTVAPSGKSATSISGKSIVAAPAPSWTSSRPSLQKSMTWSWVVLIV